MSIQILPPQLAKQIAAGEVVERPASVVKELVENSLDAGATSIKVDIEKGGAKLICVRDNGYGIAKAELAVALERHATSKIASLDDLEAITSLGFRGEALASVSSISRLTLTSRTAEQNEAWQGYTEGRDIKVTMKPAAHPVGTSLEVLDLFYNMPARRKFMRTEKTEFTYIDEIIRRIALARFDVAISLTHNGKLIHQYRAVDQEAGRNWRLGLICGTAFTKHALCIDCQHDNLALRGWVADLAWERPFTDRQYCYVNGRMIRDKLINHAIRQAYQSLGDYQQPVYVLYLEIDPHQVDVNVHPAKHEVRFHQSRMVHDFIWQGIMSTLQTSCAAELALVHTKDPVRRGQQENSHGAGTDHFSQPVRDLRINGKESGGDKLDFQKQDLCESAVYQHLIKISPLETQQLQYQQMHKPPDLESQQALITQSFGLVLSIVRERYALLELGDTLQLLSLSVAERYLKQAQLLPGKDGLKLQPLLIPVRLKISCKELEAINMQASILNLIGIDLQREGQHVILRAVPLPLRTQNLQILIPELLNYLVRHPEVSQSSLTKWLAVRDTVEDAQWNHPQAIKLLVDLERSWPQLLKSPPSDLIQTIEIETVINALEYE